jgi:alanyl-tRNA synthetase
MPTIPVLYLSLQNPSLTSVVKKFISIPGESYPETDVSLIHTPVSVEPCCGTHVFSTDDIQESILCTSISTENF